MLHYKKAYKNLSLDKLDKEEKLEYLNKVKDQVQSMIDSLTFQEENAPMRLLGFKANFQLVETIVVAILTLLAAVAQRYLG